MRNSNGKLSIEKFGVLCSPADGMYTRKCCVKIKLPPRRGRAPCFRCFAQGKKQFELREGES